MCNEAFFVLSTWFAYFRFLKELINNASETRIYLQDRPYYAK